MLSQFYCNMEYFDVDCIPAPFAVDVMVPIRTMPPCSVKVTIYGDICDNAVEFLDMNVYYDDVQPPGCATRADVHAAFLQWMSFTAFAFQEFFRQFYLPTYDASHPLNLIPNCPSTKAFFAATAVACRKPVIIWTIPDIVNPTLFTSVTVNYDLSQPWSYYEATKPIGATTAVIELVNCGESCCYHVVEACKSGGAYVITTTNPLPMTNPCPVPNTDPNCRVF